MTRQKATEERLNFLLGEISHRTKNMTWREEGGPDVRAPERSGFGRLVIEKMVAASMAGEVTLRFEAEGGVWSLRAAVTAVCAE